MERSSNKYPERNVEITHFEGIVSHVPTTRKVLVNGEESSERIVRVCLKPTTPDEIPEIIETPIDEGADFSLGEPVTITRITVITEENGNSQIIMNVRSYAQVNSLIE